MEFIADYAFRTPTNEMPDAQPPSPSYPDPGQQAPMNPSPIVPGTDAPEVNTGSRMDDDIPAEETDENEVSSTEAENP